MKKLMYLHAQFILVLVSVAFAGCASNAGTAPSGASNNFMVRTELATTSVYPAQPTAAQKGDPSAPQSVDSMQITSAKLLISDISIFDKDIPTKISLKTDPALMTVDQSGSQLFATGNLPDANYDTLTIHLHRLSDAELGLFASRSDFASFVTSNRSSVVLTGVVYKGGVQIPFTYAGRLDANLNYTLPNFHVYNGYLATLALVINPTTLFTDKPSRSLVDPVDPTSMAKIDANLQSAFSIERR